jgi:hypothetical protein
MKIDKKYFIRRNLDSYSEVEFAKFLEKKRISAFYPFRDIGIDVLAFNGRRVELYQLKARNEQSRYPNVYWFPIRKKDIEKLSKFPNSFFIFCALQPNNKFDFFKLPIDVVKKYIKLREKTTKKSEKMFLEIKKIGKKKYIIKPERISKYIDINKYLL